MSSTHIRSQNFEARHLWPRVVIEQAPLQTYSSAMIFAPKNSLVRKGFEKDIPKWITRKPKVREDWSASLQTLEGHCNSGKAVAFSPDGQLVTPQHRTNQPRRPPPGRSAKTSHPNLCPHITLIRRRSLVRRQNKNRPERRAL